MYNDIITVKSKGISDQAELCNKSISPIKEDNKTMSDQSMI